MRLPSLRETLNLLKNHGNPPNIIRHSIRVAQVALEILKKFDISNNLDRKLIITGALLHDITKMKSIKTGEDHAQTGATLIKKLGYNELAPLIKYHILLKEPIANPHITEVELVFYADKRVKHTEVVSLKERFLDVIKRYCKNQKPTPDMLKTYKQAIAIEKIIFANIDLTPRDLLKLNKKPIDIKEIKKWLED